MSQVVLARDRAKRVTLHLRNDTVGEFRIVKWNIYIWNNHNVGTLRNRALEKLEVDAPLDKIRFYVEHGDKSVIGRVIDFDRVYYRLEWLKDVKDDDDVTTLFSAEPTIIVDIVEENGKGFINNKNNMDS